MAMATPSFRTSKMERKTFLFLKTRIRKQQDRAAESLQEVHVCSLIVGWLYLYRNNASDALFFVQFYVHGSVGF